ncbi:MAG: condensation domain-containing protein [Rhizobiaceae bacterium]
MSERKLGVFEQTWAVMDGFVPVLFVGVLRLTNGPEPEVLSRALAALQTKRLMLRTGIVQKGRDYFFVENKHPPSIPLTVLKRVDGRHWRKIAEDELNTSMVTEAPLFRCAYLVGEQESELVFTFHHTIIDSRAGLSLVDQLMQLCIGEDGEAASPGQEYQPPLENLYPERLRGWRRPLRVLQYLGGQLREEVAYRFRLKGRQPVDGSSVARNKVLTTSLTAGMTSDIARAVRKERLPLNGLLHAVMLIAVHQCRYSGKHIPMRGLSFADMRPYLSQKPPAEEMGMYMSMLPYTVTISQHTDVWSLAHAIQEQLYRATKRDDKFLAPLLSLKLVSMLLSRRSMRIGMAALSYAGPLKLPEQYGDIEVQGLSGFVTNNVLGPELGVFGTILHDRLNLDFVYLDTDMTDSEAEELVGAIVRLLASLAGDERKFRHE